MQDFREVRCLAEESRTCPRGCTHPPVPFRKRSSTPSRQVRRATASIPANIAEGCGRGGNAELRCFLLISLGSASELEYHFILAHDLEYVSVDVYDNLTASIEEVKRMLTGFIRRVATSRTSESD